MRFEAVESITPLELIPASPIVIEQATSRLSAIANAAILVPASLAMLVPFGLVAGLAASEQGLLASLAEKPVTSVQLLMALALCAGLVAVSVRRLTARLARGARVEITPESVRVAERGMVRCRVWSAPLASYHGVAHYVRSTLSGTRHELQLLHPDAAKSLLIEIAPRIAESRIAEIAAILRLPVVPARSGTG